MEQSNLAKPRKVNLRAVTQVNPIRPRYANGKTASLPERVKPDTGGEETGVSIHWAFRGSWGQREGKIRRGTWETRRWGKRTTDPITGGINNRGEMSRPEVGEAHSSEEAGNDRGAKGPHRSTLM